jgi:hypothetical protein
MVGIVGTQEATCLYGEDHTLPLSLPPGAWDEEGDSSYASVTAQLGFESALFLDTLTYRLGLDHEARLRTRW